MTMLRLVCAATILAAGACLPAWAKAEVSLYGSIDLGIHKESGAPARMGRGSHNLIGIKGRDNLGDGHAAVFNLQAFFNRRHEPAGRLQAALQGESTVGLQSREAGTVRLGRALSPLWQNIWLFEPWKTAATTRPCMPIRLGVTAPTGSTTLRWATATFHASATACFIARPNCPA